jgi:hypothetical protein
LHVFSSVSSSPQPKNTCNVIDAVEVSDNKEKKQKDNSKIYGNSKNLANIETYQQKKLEMQPAAISKDSPLSLSHFQNETQILQRNFRQSKSTRKRKELLIQLESKIVNKEKRQRPVDSMEQLTTEIAEFFLSFIQ